MSKYSIRHALFRPGTSSKVNLSNMNCGSLQMHKKDAAYLISNIFYFASAVYFNCRTIPSKNLIYDSDFHIRAISKIGHMLDQNVDTGQTVFYFFMILKKYIHFVKKKKSKQFIKLKLQQYIEQTEHRTKTKDKANSVTINSPTKRAV